MVFHPVNVEVVLYVREHSLWSLSSFWKLLHHRNEFLCPVPGRADVHAEEVLLRGRRHSKWVPLQPRDGRAVEEYVLADLHLEAFLHQLQLKCFGGTHHNLRRRQGRTWISCREIP